MTASKKVKTTAKSRPAKSVKPARQTSPEIEKVTGTTGITWGGWTAIGVAAAVFVAASLIAVQLVGVYPLLHGWTRATAANWLNNSVTAQFFLTVFIEALTVGGLLWFIRWRKGSLAAIGLKRPRLEDVAYALLGLLIYLPALIVASDVVQAIFHNLNFNQQQVTGFGSNITGWPLLLVFFSLVILPPIAEEIMFRGFMYSGLKKNLPKISAALVTSALFAGLHLFESANGGLLWSAGIDTFVLSLTLLWLRERTGRLYAGMGLHALKNFIAFVALYPIIHIH